MKEHIVLDLETLGTGPGCVILQIGAVAIDLESDEAPGEGEVFGTTISVGLSLVHGFMVDDATHGWWLEQDRDLAWSVMSGNTEPERALRDFGQWVEKVGGKYVWGNGPDFDVSILRAYYEEFCIDWPFAYNAPRDVRTIVDLAKRQGFDPKSIPFEGNKHDGVDDALHEAKLIRGAYRMLSGAVVTHA